MAVLIKWSLARLRSSLFVALFGIAYFLLARLGLTFVTPEEQVAVLWPAAGLAVAVLVLSPRRSWPVLVLVIAAANLLAQSLSREVEPAIVGLAVVNALEAVIAAAVLLAIAGELRRFVYGSRRGVLALLVAATVASGVGAVLGGGLISLTHDAPLLSGVLTWWLADGLGILAVAPLVLAWRDRRRPKFTRGEIALLVGVVVASAAIGYPEISGVPQALVQSFVLLPVLVWTAVKAQPRISSAATVALIAIMAQATIAGHGPLATAGASELDGLETLQVFMIVAALLAMLVEAILATRRQTERELAATSEGLQSVLGAATEFAIVSVDGEGRITVFNEGAERMLGYPADEVIGGSPADFHEAGEIATRAHELGIAPGFEVFVHAARRGEVETRRWTFIRQDGERLPVSLTVNPRHREDGELVGFISIAQDISARLEFEAERAALVLSSRAVAAAEPLEPTLDLIAREVGNLNATTTAVITRFESTEVGTVLGAWNAQERLPAGHPVNLSGASAAAAVSRSGYACRVGMEAVGEDQHPGNGCPARVGAPVFVDSVLWGAISVGASHADDLDDDVEERLARFADLVGLAVTNDKNRREVERNRDELSAIIDGLPALVWVRDLSGRLLIANRDFAELDGHGGAPGSRRDLLERLSNPTLDADALAGEEALTVEQDFIDASGEQRALLVSRSPLMDADGRVYALSCVATDITERRAHERAKDEFIQIVSHELRTPLSSIRGALSLLSEDDAAFDDVARQRMVNIASSNSERLVALINDILDLQRIAAGGTVLHPAECDSGDLVRQAEEAMGAFAAEKGVELVASPAAFPLFAEGHRVVQVLNNYLSNAIKFSAPGSRVEVGSIPREGEAVFYVRDEGPGIPPDMLETIFERFQQVDSSASRAVGGTGLGLTICQEIAGLHDGRVWAESEFGEGSCFWFAVPLTLMASIPGPLSSGDESVLICDDDPETRAATRDVVEALGFDVREADSGDEAIRLARMHAPHAVLLDLMIPGIDGFETLSRLAEDPSTAPIPVVMMSTLPPDRVESPPVPIADWIIKPATPEDMIRALSLARVSPQVSGVLIVEDDPGLADVLLEQLRRDNIPAVHAGTGRQAIEMAARIQPALIVLDVGLPDGDGFAVVEALRSRDIAPAALVVYSALDLGDDERKRLTLGRTDFFTKSRISPRDFHRELASMIPEVTAA